MSVFANGFSTERAHAIRGGACILVVIGHAWQIFMYPTLGYTDVFHVLGGLAAWAVAVFFVLSGMLIALSIIGRSQDKVFSTRAYLKARVIRIFPPLLAALIVTVVAVLVIQAAGLYGSEAYRLPGDLAEPREKAIIEWGSVFPTMTLTYYFIPGWRHLSFNGPLWSLTFEFWCYVLAGLGAAAVFRRQWWVACLFVCLLAWVLLCSDPLFKIVGSVWFIGFAAGLNWRSIAVRRSWLLPAAALLAGLAVWVGGGSTPSLLEAPYDNGWFYLTVSVSLLCLVAWMLTGSGNTGPVVKSLSFVGDFSYTLYLIHFPIMLFFLSLLRPAVVQYGLSGDAAIAVFSILVCLGSAWALARLVEDRVLMGRCWDRGIVIVSRPFVTPSKQH